MGGFVWTEWRAMWVGLFGQSGELWGGFLWKKVESYVGGFLWKKVERYMGGFVWTKWRAMWVGLFELS